MGRKMSSALYLGFHSHQASDRGNLGNGVLSFVIIISLVLLVLICWFVLARFLNLHIMCSSE